MTKISLTLSEGARRLDSLLAELLLDKGMSRSRLQRLIRDGRVTVDGSPAKPSMEVFEGQEVVVEAEEPRPFEVTPLDRPLTVLYEDEACLAVDKPAGMVTHPAKGHWDDTLVNVLASRCRDLSSGFGPDRPGILHRLDKETSGVLLVAKTDNAHAFLADQFKARSLTKVYLALVWGSLADDPVEVDAPIARHPKHRRMMAVSDKGRPSVTVFTTRESLKNISLVEARPRTGRTHQVRLHLAHLHHPVVGDALYGGHPENGLPSKILQKLIREAGRFFLHAHVLSFQSPAAGEVRVVSPIPRDFLELMEAFRTHA